MEVDPGEHIGQNFFNFREESELGGYVFFFPRLEKARVVRSRWDGKWMEWLKRRSSSSGGGWEQK